MRFISLTGFVALLIYYPTLLNGQVNPDPDEVFIPNEIAEIQINMSEADKIELLADENIQSNTYYVCNLTFENSSLNESVNNVGIRLRGNTSRSHPKRSFKIDFREFGGEKFHDHKKFNLKAENNDPSQVREHLALEVMRLANVPAARSAHTRLYINGEYMGLYLNVEQIDDEFVQSRFQNDSGNLYKCYWGSTLEHDGQIFDEAKYELKTNEEINDRSVLNEMVTILNNPTLTNWDNQIENVFNVSRFVKYLAAEALLGHWDGYSYNKNNFYLYESPDTGLVEFIAYDVDNTFGIDWVNRDWSVRDVLDWQKHNDPRPLAGNILDIQRFKEQYIIELTRLLDQIFTEQLLFPKLDSYRTLLSDAVRDDEYFPLTFGFSHQTFIDSYELNNLANHLPYGLKTYITLRSNSARNQIPEVVLTNIDDTSHDSIITLFPNPQSGRYLFISTDGPLIQEPQLLDIHGKPVAFDAERANQYTMRLDIQTDLPPGLYILKMNGVTRKWMRE